MEVVAGAQRLRKLARYVEKAGHRLAEGEQGRRVRPWFAADGDATLRVEYDLGPDSVVVDVGGYRGQWASDIVARYLCTVHVFEPVPAYAEQIQQRFRLNDRVVVHAAALGSENGSLRLALEADRSSAHLSGRDATDVPVRAAVEVFEELGLAHIDLMKVNVEGGEFELLPHLIKTGWISRVRDLQVQFHDFVPDAHARMRHIQQELSRTHRATYSFPFVWENWRLTSS
jgi:FkbM family methyltransferase